MKDMDKRVFDTAFALWASRSKIFSTRQRLKRYTYGDQWGDMISNDDGAMMIESSVIKMNGRRPITNNLIRRLIKTIVGRYRDMATENGWYDTANAEASLLEELDSRLLEEFLISGMAIQRVGDDNPLQPDSGTVTNVNPEAFFCNDFRDPRGYDIDLAGMLHDMSPAEILLRFPGKTEDERRKVQNFLAAGRSAEITCSSASRQFLVAAPGRHRVVEVWTRELTRARKVKWRVRWFTGDGMLLDSYDSPWRHGGHPFAVKFYPLTDGEIHSFVEDIIDQQRYINRLIVLIDSILKTSAKGVLLFPTPQLTPGFPLEKVKEAWAKPGGVIEISGRSNILPQQLSASGGDTAAYRLLEMELNLFDRTSGVGSALTGTAAADSAGLGHYRAQVESATIALADVFRTFRALTERRDALLTGN